MPVPIPSKTEDGALPGQGRYMEAVGDDELGLVAGGQQFIFRGEGFQRDSWFVTFMLKRMIQDSVRQQDLTRTLDAVPQELRVEGRVFRVWQTGETVFVEEVL